ncbi:hypothetical protein SmJEL517_g03556 [Synchytrium microbalum]|uniref:non-specific serine/threonine protein kinase n=1 Tax=Synchytrium microbalum TaxID=1806994 RepID=A0A507C7Z1_9FUNG|nr:uncharacterized protein SmJEL517_g03556 [Synchytrium microbalum]TPX33615.1 hypothetical protein SmJEL517_g03556 [Synchytrium microbalum]
MSGHWLQVPHETLMRTPNNRLAFQQQQQQKHRQRPRSSSSCESITSRRDHDMASHATTTQGARGVPVRTHATLGSSLSVEVLLRDYAVKQTIGQGAFSKVKLGVHNETKQKVAIKIIDKAYYEKQITQGSTQSSKKSKESEEKQIKVPKNKRLAGHAKTRGDSGLLREIELMMRVNDHPNIIRLYRVIDTVSTTFVVMQCATKGELIETIASKGGKLKEPEARQYFRQILSAIDHCHQAGVTHRDLKLENILLDDDGNVRVADFGLGRSFNERGLYEVEPYLGTFCGTPVYAGPELILHRAYQGSKADVWAMGVVLYAMVAGNMPFASPTLAGLYEAIVHGVWSKPKDISESLLDLLQSMFIVNAENRIDVEGIMKHKWITEDGASPMIRTTPKVTAASPATSIVTGISGEEAYTLYIIADHEGPSSKTSPSFISFGRKQSSAATGAEIPAPSSPDQSRARTRAKSVTVQSRTSNSPRSSIFRKSTATRNHDSLEETLNSDKMVARVHRISQAGRSQGRPRSASSTFKRKTSENMTTATHELKQVPIKFVLSTDSDTASSNSFPDSILLKSANGSDELLPQRRGGSSMHSKGMARRPVSWGGSVSTSSSTTSPNDSSNGLPANVADRIDFDALRILDRFQAVNILPRLPNDDGSTPDGSRNGSVTYGSVTFVDPFSSSSQHHISPSSPSHPHSKAASVKRTASTLGREIPSSRKSSVSASSPANSTELMQVRGSNAMESRTTRLSIVEMPEDTVTPEIMLNKALLCVVGGLNPILSVSTMPSEGSTNSSDVGSLGEPTNANITTVLHQVELTPITNYNAPRQTSIQTPGSRAVSHVSNTSTATSLAPPNSPPANSTASRHQNRDNNNNDNTGPLHVPENMLDEFHRLHKPPAKPANVAKFPVSPKTISTLLPPNIFVELHRGITLLQSIFSQDLGNHLTFERPYDSYLLRVKFWKDDARMIQLRNSGALEGQQQQAVEEEILLNSERNKLVEFEVEVCKVWLLNMHGLRFKRLYGDPIVYKDLRDSLVNVLRL